MRAISPAETIKIDVIHLEMSRTLFPGLFFEYVKIIPRIFLDTAKNSHLLFVYKTDADKKRGKMTGKELEQIYNEGYRTVYWTAMALLKNEADAEDVVQDTFIALMESYDSIKDKSKVMSWLKKTAANKCLDRIKLAKTDNMDDEFFDSCEAVPEDFLPDSIIESEESRRIVTDIINNSLSEEIRRTVILFYFNEMSIKEIAAALGVPEGTVSRRLNSARHKIKKEVEKYEKDKKTKLFGMALPFLSKLFIKEAEQVPFKPMPASLLNLSASTQSTAAKAGTKIAQEAVKKGTGIMNTKIIIGVVAAAAAITAATAVVLNIPKQPAGKPDATIESQAEDTDATALTEKGGQVTGASESDVSVSAEEYEPIYIVLDDMSLDEIVADIDSIRTVKTDSTLDYYPERFEIANPIDYYTKDTELWYVWRDGVYETDYKDYSTFVSWIDFIDVSNNEGIYSINENTTLCICLTFHDKDKAIEVYERMLVELEAFGEITSDYRDELSDKSGWHTIAVNGDTEYKIGLIQGGSDGDYVYHLIIRPPFIFE